MTMHKKVIFFWMTVSLSFGALEGFGIGNNFGIRRCRSNLRKLGESPNISGPGKKKRYVSLIISLVVLIEFSLFIPLLPLSRPSMQLHIHFPLRTGMVISMCTDKSLKEGTFCGFILGYVLKMASQLVFWDTKSGVGERKLQKNELGFANLCQVLDVLISKSAWIGLDFELSWAIFFGHFFIPTASLVSCFIQLAPVTNLYHLKKLYLSNCAFGCAH